MLAASAALADPPADNVGRHRHPNLAAAQRLSTQAFEKIVAAQKANEFDLGGPAQKAKDLPDELNRELKAAARPPTRITTNGLWLSDLKDQLEGPAMPGPFFLRASAAMQRGKKAACGQPSASTGQRHSGEDARASVAYRMRRYRAPRSRHTDLTSCNAHSC